MTELLTSVKRPERFIGLHFFNPVPLMKLVEVVRTIATSAEVYEAAYSFAQRLGKVPVRTSDGAGGHSEPVAGAVFAGCDSGV